MDTLICPHCGEPIRLDDNTHSAVSVLDDDQNLRDYHPNPTRQYKSSEKLRRQGLAWYYKNRERRLEAMRAYRQKTTL